MVCKPHQTDWVAILRIWGSFQAVMRSVLCFPLLLASLLSVVAGDAGVNRSRPALLPMPQAVKWSGGAVKVDKVAVEMADGLAGADGLRIGGVLDDLLARNHIARNEGAVMRVVIQTGKVKVPSHWPGQGREAYRLVVDGNGVQITANAPAGVFYALQTLRQLTVSRDGKTTMAACKILDYPAFRVRGMMHDVGRNFQSLEQSGEQSFPTVAGGCQLHAQAGEILHAGGVCRVCGLLLGAWHHSGPGVRHPRPQRRIPQGDRGENHA